MVRAHSCALVLLASAGLCVPLSCSSSTDGGQGHSDGNAGTGAVGSSSTGGAGSSTDGASTLAGSGGSTDAPASSAGTTGNVAGRLSAPDAGDEGGSTAVDGGSTGGGPGGNATTASTVASAGAIDTAGRSAAGGTSGNGGRGGSSTGGTSIAGGTTTGGTTAVGDSLCPPGITRTITVAKDGSGQFNSVQAAVNSITSGSSARIRVDIKAGTYTEKLTIASRTNLCMVGASATTTILSYGDSNASTGGTSTSASVHISADDFSAANLTFQNSYGAGSQAVALRTTGHRQQFLNCRFVGYQDTLYTHDGSQYFKNCYVQGNTDYVFGGATAVLQNCEVRNVESGSAVVAPNTDASSAFGIVFLGGKFTAASGVKSVALGRPWGADGFAAYLNVELGSHILAAGFVAMSGNQPQNARFHEYGSTGGGANTSSRSAYQLTAAQAANYTLSKILGSWSPTYSQ